MKSAKQVLSKNLKFCTPLCDGWDEVVESVLEAMEEYANQFRPEGIETKDIKKCPDWTCPLKLMCKRFDFSFPYAHIWHGEDEDGIPFCNHIIKKDA